MTATPEPFDFDDRAPASTPTSERRGWFKDQPGWIKILLVTAGLLVVAGLVLIPLEGGSDGGGAGATPGTGTTPGGATGLVGDGTVPGGSGTPASGEASESLSPAFLRLGFSFFVGFAIGYALRSFLKLALIVIGLQLIALFGLEYVDWISVNWDSMGTFFDGFVERVKQEAESFKSFVTGSLPTAGLAGLGLYAGFRKR